MGTVNVTADDRLAQAEASWRDALAEVRDLVAHSGPGWMIERAESAAEERYRRCMILRRKAAAEAAVAQ